MPDEKIVKEFPCPKCGSRDRFIERIAAKEREKGSIPKELMGAIEIESQVVVNPRPLIPYVPGMIKPSGSVLWDICMECGTKYCFMIVEGESALQGTPLRMARGHP